MKVMNDYLYSQVDKIIKNANLDYQIKWNINDNIFPDQPAEFFYGSREYKRHIIDITEYPGNVNLDLARRKFINKKATQMLFRLNEGSGRALYIIGVEDNGEAIGISHSEVLETLSNFICMTNLISGSVIRGFNIYRTRYNKYVCTFRIYLVFCLDTLAIF